MTVDTAHTIAPASMTREAFYVAMTRGRHRNHAYLPTDTPPPGVDPTTIHQHQTDPDETTGRDVLLAILTNTGADTSAHQTIRELADQAESIRQLAAEYETIAAAAHTAATEDALIETAAHLDEFAPDTVLGDPHADELLRAARAARAAGLPVDAALPGIVEQLPPPRRTAPGIADATRVWTTAVAAGRTPPTRRLIAGLIPAAEQGIADPDLKHALTDRETLLEQRADAVLHRAESNRATWLQPLLHHRPAEPHAARRWLVQARLVAAYRDRWGLTDLDDPAPTGAMPPAGADWSQLADRRRAKAAVTECTTPATAAGKPTTMKPTSTVHH